MENMSDIELVERTHRGDREAFACLVNRHYMLVYRVAYKWCGMKENAEDITQEVFVKLARVIHGFKGNSKFVSWLYRIAVNTTKDFLRSNSRKMANEAAYVEEKLSNALHSSVTINENADNQVSSKIVYSALDSLSSKLKEAVILVLSEGLSHKEAGEVLGCAETTVSWRVFQARRKLKKLLLTQDSFMRRVDIKL